MLTREQARQNLGEAELARRAEAERLYTASNAADEALENYDSEHADDPREAAINDEIDAKIAALNEERGARIAALFPERAALTEASEASASAWINFDSSDFFLDQSDEHGIRRCAVSGAPLFIDDDFVRVADGVLVLVAALGIDPELLSKHDDSDEIPVLPEGFGE